MRNLCNVTCGYEEADAGPRNSEAHAKLTGGVRGYRVAVRGLGPDQEICARDLVLFLALGEYYLELAAFERWLPLFGCLQDSVH